MIANGFRRLCLPALLLMTIPMLGCMPEGILLIPVSPRMEMEEELLSCESLFAGDKIAIIPVEGVIMNTPEPRLIGEGENPVSVLTEQLDRARRDPAVKAAVLRINSPGGGVTASALMYDEIQRFRASGKPIVACMMDVAASGGYYIACGCDDIWANPTTVTGSIGVISQYFDFTGTMHKIGISAPSIVSGPNKAAGSPFQTMTPEQREIFQAIVDDMFQQFLEVVDKGRPELTTEQVRKLADGRVYTAGQALDAGLIDHVGTLRDAISAAKKLSGSESIQLVRYRRPLAYTPNYYSSKMGGSTGDVNLLKVDLPEMMRQSTPQFLYLWAP